MEAIMEVEDTIDQGIKQNEQFFTCEPENEEVKSPVTIQNSNPQHSPLENQSNSIMFIKL